MLLLPACAVFFSSPFADPFSSLIFALGATAAEAQPAPTTRPDFNGAVALPTTASQTPSPSPAAKPNGPPDCKACTVLDSEWLSIRAQHDSMSKLLVSNQNALKVLGDESGAMSKKIKITSNILILTTRTEKLNNDLELRTKQKQEKGCAQCKN